MAAHVALPWIHRHNSRPPNVLLRAIPVTGNCLQADRALFLLSDESSYITGAEGAIDGGASLLPAGCRP